MSRLTLAFALTALALTSGCGGGRAGSADVTSCTDACDAQLAACPDVDHQTCVDLCDAYAIVLTDACAPLFDAWQACLAGQTYECFEDVAIPADSCAAEFDAYEGC